MLFIFVKRSISPAYHFPYHTHNGQQHFGIHKDTFMDWGANERKLSTKGFELVQKLRDFREESLSNKLATGNKNPVGILAILNRHFAWNLPGVSRENTNKTALTAAEIRQQLSQNNTQLTDKQQINAVNNSDTI